MSMFAAPLALDASALPLKSSSDLVLVPITSEELQQTWYLNSDEWRGPLDDSQYFERESQLIKQDLTRDNGITGWILTSPQLFLNPDGTKPILAACETILKTAYVARNGKIETVRAHGVCSVYTRKEYRGRGYASRMMIELSKHLDTYQQHNGTKGTFSVLFSDIGKDFYSRYGWVAYPSTHINLAVMGSEQYQSAKTKFPTVDDLTVDDLEHIPMIDYLEETLKTISSQRLNVPHIAIRPDRQHFGWHFAREELQIRLLGLPFPHIKGAICKSTGIAIIWTRVPASKPDQWLMHILHLAIPPKLRDDPTEEARDALAALLLRAQHEASEWKMLAGVEVWDPSELVVSAAQKLRLDAQDKVQVISRDNNHVCSLRWIGARPGDDNNADVVWVNMEMYTWC